MTIHLGEGGFIELQRNSANLPIVSTLEIDDVNPARRRFSCDYVTGSLITGDRAVVGTVDKSNLELVSGHDFPDGLWYLHVDEAGGIRLYDSFFGALEGEELQAVGLVQPSKQQEIFIKLEESEYRCLAQVDQYEFTTTRETMDLTNLGDEFRRNYENGLIGGQGNLSCFWDYKRGTCGEPPLADQEVPHYLAKLIIRTQMGASFLGKFYLHRPMDAGDGAADYLYYEAKCIITNCILSMIPTEPVMAKIDFVTTGSFHLKRGATIGYLLQEDGNKVLQEDGHGIVLDQQ